MRSKIGNMFALIFLLLPSLLEAFEGSEPFEKFEYKYTFRPPYLSQPDGSIPFWEKYGNALPSEAVVRLTTSLRNQKGAVWTKNKTTFENWEVEFHFRMSGRGRTGGEGLAFWYLNEKPSYSEGSDSIFGGPPGTWQGLGIIWDTYDNDGNFQQPSIIGVLNDQSVLYNYDQDGAGQYFSLTKRDFLRNTMYTLKAKVRWYNRMLSLHFNNGDVSHPTPEQFTPCFFYSNISEAQMPKFGYFGISAATRIAADNHDIFSFHTRSLYPPEMRAQFGSELDPDFREKAKKVYEELSANAERKRAEYFGQHPEAKAQLDHKAQEDDEDDEELLKYADEMGQEFRKVFIEQHETSRDLVLLLKRADEILGKVEVISGAVGRLSLSPTGAAAALPPAQGQAPAPQATPIYRTDMDSLLSSSKELLQTIKEIKDVAQTVVGSLDRNEFNEYFKLNKEQVTEKPVDGNEIIREAKTELYTLQLETENILFQIGRNEAIPCPVVCVGTKAYLLISSFFTLIILLILVGKDVKNSNSQRYY